MYQSERKRYIAGMEVAFELTNIKTAIVPDFLFLYLKNKLKRYVWALYSFNEDKDLNLYVYRKQSIVFLGVFFFIKHGKQNKQQNNFTQTEM